MNKKKEKKERETEIDTEPDTQRTRQTGEKWDKMIPSHTTRQKRLKTMESGPENVKATLMRKKSPSDGQAIVSRRL